MKNIYILPTQNPSRLLKTIPKGNILLSNINISGPHWENLNLYITSNEEIKINDHITDGYSTWKWKDNSSLLGRKKIILTTNQELINDGIQHIDDEFLKWFVKNLSCEEVECVYGLINPMGKIVNPNDLGQNRSQCVWKYKIIIPKEEPKQTLEDAAINNYKELYEGEPLTQDVPINAFKDGAKWQQERMYNEEEVLVILHKRMKYTLGEDYKEETTLKWFEQFKKK